MKRLGLLRHAKSDWSDSDLRDYDRDLNARGCRGARIMGRHIREHGTAWDMVVASPAQRVRTTLQHALPDVPVVWDRRLYLASADTIVEVLHEAEGDTVLLAGHNPGMGNIILDLVAPDAENAMFDEAVVKFPTAAFAVLELDIEHWGDLARHSGRLVHFKRPRDLDPDLGPEY